MKKYIITIVDLRTSEHRTILSNNDSHLQGTINAYCGGWDNMQTHITTNGSRIGILKDRPAKFSIICYTPQN